MVDVGDRKLGFDAGNIHGLEFEVGHGPGRILSQGLVDPDRDGLAGFAAAFHKMRFDDFLNNGPSGHGMNSCEKKL